MDNSEKKVLKEIEETKRQIELTNSVYRQKQLKKRLKKLENELKTYRRLKYGTNGLFYKREIN